MLQISQSQTLGQSRQVKMSNPAQDLFRRIRSISIDGHERRPLETISPAHSMTPSIIGSRIDTDESSDELDRSSPPSVLDGSIDDALYDQLQEVMAEASNARQAAFEEAGRRGKAKRNAIDTIRKAKASEALYNEELKLRKEIEEALSKEKDELEKMKKQMEEVMEELQIPLTRNPRPEIISREPNC